ncbi:Nbs-lrr resistance protein, putative [Theobroma cacao]|uniref:Nbs-lrr resistance protein, putative n=1 Tax=Theobroma cacao TaxID=3641 RepID=A0A061G6S4_THECC|nr:Nbs-lrr resistance protein, putative [Theobroma cacao]
MAEIAVEFILEKIASFLQNEIASFLQNEIQILQGVPEELEYIRDDLQRMKASLRAADLVEDSDHQLKEWVRQVRDIAYDIEDVIDGFNFHHADQHGHRIHGFLYHFCCFVKNLEGYHQTADKLRKIRSRIRNVSAWQLNNAINLSTTDQGSSSMTTSDALILDSADLVGIDESKELLVRWLVERNPGRKVLSVVGMGGLGKTTLVKQVYDDERVKKHFDVHVWIALSHPFKMEDFLRNIVQQLFSAIRKPVPEGIDDMNSDWLKVVIKPFLRQWRYLIVLDNVWHINQWHAVNHAFAKNDSNRVMITTRNTDVAIASCLESDDMVFNIEPLSSDYSWDLFCRRSFRGNTCPPYLVEVSRRILEKCEGLPLAIVAISGLLSTKTGTPAEWETIYRSLGAIIKDNDKLMNLTEVLSLSFKYLPYHLKSCFLYLSIFPDNYLIERMRLIRLWIAEGFVEVKEGKTQEEVAEDYLNELLSRSLVQVFGRTSDGRVKTCRIHDLLREIIISKSRDQNFAAIAKDKNGAWPDKVRRLSLHNSLQNVQHNRNVSHLRSFFMFEVEDPLLSAPLHSLYPDGFRLLKVLDLRAARLQTFPGEIINLFLLRYLSLRETKVNSIPSSIGKLQNLQTLDLKHTNVTELPVEILKLQQLRHLLVYRYEFKYYSRFHSKYGFKALAGIGALQSLQKLCFIEADHRNASILEEVGKLTQLRRLGIMNLRKEDGMALCSSIQKLTNLQALSVVSSVKDEVIDLHHLASPPQLLERLYLTGRLEQLPDWIPRLQSLVIVYLKWSRLEDDPLLSLQHLSNLVHLELLQVSIGDTLSFKAGGFQKLKVLGIDKFDELRCIEMEEGAMPVIEKLSILRCKSLETVPFGIEHLTTLKVLEFFDMPEELIKTLSPNAKGGDYRKVARIPEVYYTYCRDGEWEVYSLESSGKRVLSVETVESHLESIVKK